MLTNPDMLHVGILPHHHAWDELLANLAFVVVDEAHTYRGVFGSHVANVLRGCAARPRSTARSPLSARQRDDRKPGRAGRGPHRGRRLSADRRDGAPNAPPAGPRCGTRPCSTSDSACAARRCTRRPRCSPSLISARHADDLLHEVAQGNRADRPPRPRAARARACRADRALPRRLYARTAPARSSSG